MNDKDQAETLKLSPPKTPIQQLEDKEVSGPSSMTLKEPAMVPGPSGSVLAPVERMEAQLAEKKFQNMKNKNKARKLMACEQHGLAKYPTPTLEPESANNPPQPMMEIAMEVDPPATNGITSDVLIPCTSQEQPRREPKEPTWLKYLTQILEKE